MRFLLMCFIPVFVLSQDIEDILQKLINYKNTSSSFTVGYSPFKKTILKDETSAKQNEIIIDKEEGMSLKAIFNKRAFISGAWYEEGDKCFGYTIEKISDNSIVVKKGNEVKKITLGTFEKYLDVRKK